MRRSVLGLCSLTVVMLVASGCGGGEEQPSDAKSGQTSASSSASASASSSALPAGCSAPAADVTYTDGSASFDVTSGPDEGHYDLELESSASNGYAASDKEITGNWISADEKAVLFIDIEGTDPCKPDAFTSIGTQGAGGPVFVDSSHTACTVELTSLGDAGAQGTFTCSGLMGGGEGLTRDAKGTFTLLP